ncbi:hypothetical protein AB4537_24365, partial [Vibrio sp. 10N.222.51.F1]|uniref:hypothetical protein n=1 Tax=Vibrio TaxID=662 RepID=UPI00197D742C
GSTASGRQNGSQDHSTPICSMFNYIALSWCRFVDSCLIRLDRRLFYYDGLRLILSAALW